MEEESKIFLIRHGFCLANNVKWNNQIGLEEKIGELSYDENVPLDDYGIEQAKEVGNFLKKYLEGSKVLFFVSPYRRTRQTLEYILGEFSNTDSFDIRVNKSIREMNAGIHYAKTNEEIMNTFPKEYNEYLINVDNLSSHKDKGFIPYVRGEGQQDVRRRVYYFSKELKKIASTKIDNHLKYDYICVISHNFVNRWICYWLNNKVYNSIPMKNGEIRIGNGKEAGKTVFIPIAFVPKGYKVNLDKYIVNYKIKKR
ncbi:MAG: histidine phosphatase family protein [Bacilli bacterium]|nr:histidine phosphatase family protein [Bacilli bacterium]